MVGIVPAHESQFENYTSWLLKRNLPFKILKPEDHIDDCRVLILCGGPDVGLDQKRDELEKMWFSRAYGKVAILGICRGLQISNVILGGTLIEDLSEESVKHTTNKKEVSGEPKPLFESSFHDVVFSNGKKIKVNSRHHQGIKDLAPGLEPVARCTEDGLLEMVEGQNCLFVQWHPERPDVWGTEAEQVVFDWLKKYV
jgi:putative glutamine amidotransferase